MSSGRTNALALEEQRKARINSVRSRRNKLNTGTMNALKKMQRECHARFGAHAELWKTAEPLFGAIAEAISQVEEEQSHKIGEDIAAAEAATDKLRKKYKKMTREIKGLIAETDKTLGRISRSRQEAAKLNSLAKGLDELKPDDPALKQELDASMVKLIAHQALMAQDNKATNSAGAGGAGGAGDTVDPVNQCVKAYSRIHQLIRRKGVSQKDRKTLYQLLGKLNTVVTKSDSNDLQRKCEEAIRAHDAICTDIEARADLIESLYEEYTGKIRELLAYEDGQGGKQTQIRGISSFRDAEALQKEIDALEKKVDSLIKEQHIVEACKIALQNLGLGQSRPVRFAKADQRLHWVFGDGDVGVHMFYGDNGMMMFESVGVAPSLFDTEEPVEVHRILPDSPNERERLVMEQETFCSKFGELTAELRKLGVVSTAERVRAPHEQYSYVIATEEDRHRLVTKGSRRSKARPEVAEQERSL